MKTVKSYSTKEIKASELFDAKIKIFAKDRIDYMKRRIMAVETKHGYSVDFFNDDDVTFYVSYRNDITIMCDVSNVIKKKCSAWRFGFINKLIGKINLLFDGHTVADGASVSDIFCIASDIVKHKFQPATKAKLITFSIQNKNEKTNDQTIPGSRSQRD